MNQYMPRCIMKKKDREGGKKSWALSYYSNLALLYQTHPCLHQTTWIIERLSSWWQAVGVFFSAWMSVSNSVFMVDAFPAFIHRGHQQLGNGAHTVYTVLAYTFETTRIPSQYTEYKRGRTIEFGIWTVVFPTFHLALHSFGL